MKIDKAFVISILVLLGVFILRAMDCISEDMMYGIVTSVLTYWLGRTHGRSEAKCSYHEKGTNISEVLRYMGLVMMSGGAMLTFHHFFVYGFSWDVKILCHGLYGWIMFTIGFLISAKWKY